MNIIGHSEAKDILLGTNLAASRSFLIEGPKGVGKALLAQSFAGQVLGSPQRVAAKSHPDFLLIEKREAENKKEIVADDARALRGFLELTPAEGKHRVAIIDSADELNTQAANSILKMVEEPPRNSIIILLSHGGYVLPTIRSRCLSLKMRPLPDAQMQQVISLIMPSVSEADLALLTELSEGSPGIAKMLYENEGLWITDSLMEVFGAYPKFEYLQAAKFTEKLEKNDKFWEVYAYLFNWLVLKLIKSHTLGQEFSLRGATLAKSINMPLLLDELEKWQHTARESEIFNLDKKQVILSFLGRFAPCFG